MCAPVHWIQEIPYIIIIIVYIQYLYIQAYWYGTGTQGWQYGTVRYASTVRYAPFFGKKYGTLVRYVIIAKVRVRYVGTCYKYAY